MHPQTLAFLLAKIGVAPKAYEQWHGGPRLQSEGSANEILIYGPIVRHGDVAIYREWFGDETVISNQMFREQLAEITGEVTLRINSPGGDVFEASGMVQAIQERDGGVKCIVDGLAASAASLLMATCSHVTIAQMGTAMIHRAATWMFGNAPDLRQYADILEGIDTQAAGIYKSRMKASKEKIMQMLTDETWFTAEAAVKEGLADEVFEPKKNDAPAAAMIAAAKSNSQPSWRRCLKEASYAKEVRQGQASGVGG